MADAVSSKTEISVKDGQSDWLCTWEPPGRLKDWFPFHKLGPDYAEAPVFLCPFGQWNLRKLFSQGTEAEKRGMETYVKFINERFIRDSSTSEHGRGVVIYDWEGFSLPSLSQREELRVILAILRALAESQKFLSYGFFINTNMEASSFLNLSLPFPGTYLDKFEIYGSRIGSWQPRVFSKIPVDSLPAQYVISIADLCELSGLVNMFTVHGVLSMDSEWFFLKLSTAVVTMAKQTESDKLFEIIYSEFKSQGEDLL